MKLEKFELKVIGLVIITSLLAAFLLHEVRKEVNNAGGIRNIVVGAGKEVKSIIDEINMPDSVNVDTLE